MHRAGWAGTHPSYSVAGLLGSWTYISAISSLRLIRDNSMFTRC